MLFTENDDIIICKRCASKFDTLDQLEERGKSIRSDLLTDLEINYELEQGELSRGFTPLIRSKTRPAYTVTSHDSHDGDEMTSCKLMEVNRAVIEEYLQSSWEVNTK
ncbi:uncharacterized protein LOC120353362 isoform X2 [Nilaparvata lugens]|nr:uncharacterized protein LOC120353362 isoform X2 [Nilaparvata lugens]